MAGTYTTKIRGREITQRCTKDIGERGSFSELLAVIRVGSAGARIDKLVIKYTTGSGHYKRTVRNVMAPCGTAVSKSICPS
jgi:hypothetical protein